MRLDNQVALVVGSNSGMGRATAVAFAEARAKVVLAARRAETLSVLAAELGDGALACPTDAQDVAQVEHLVRTTLDRFGRIDVLVYATEDLAETLER